MTDKHLQDCCQHVAKSEPVAPTKADMRVFTEIITLLKGMSPEMQLRILCAALVFTAAEDSERVAHLVRQLIAPPEND